MENELLPEHALEYMLGGNATLIMYSDKTHDAYRVKISVKEKDRLYYVYCDHSHIYIGFIRKHQDEWYFKGTEQFKVHDPDNLLVPSRKLELIQIASKTYTAFRWTFIKLLKNEIPKELHLLHVGICSACGRPLTDPESVLKGLGPICRGKR